MTGMKPAHEQSFDFDDYASMVPQPSPGLVGARFPVRGAVKCVLAALLKRHLHRYCIDGDVAGNLGSGDGDYDFRPAGYNVSSGARFFS